ncbi:MAG: EAL domain-containing protein [Natronospirillum sp.]|uniref:putative bifunctional diguanylate cyclase/phosphodiesterase n=1 Tax=Natronospirillum sp. TaxID=2812955 RepID=UPI0025DAF3AF|nr:EAL domain-containing protein [Natronospirillum sp.]MCH8551217.1 EAL domain-containing protein [Natronospirillum sp.]
MNRIRRTLMRCCVVVVLGLVSGGGLAQQQVFDDLISGHSAVMLLIRAEDGQIISANRAAAEFYGYTADNLRQLRIDDINLLSDAQVQAERQRAAQEERNYFIFAHRLASGEVRTVEVHSNPITLDGQTYLFSVIQDITEQRLAERSLETYEAGLADLVLQRTSELEAANQRIQAMALGGMLVALVIIVLLSISAVQYRRILSRIRKARTELTARNEEAYELAYFDALTQLPNRQYLIDRLRAAQDLAEQGEHQFCLTLIDLDRFKDINDSRGHDAGDWLLQKVAARLLDSTQAGDTVARLGGDEFAVLSDISGHDLQQKRAHAANQAERVRRSLGLPYVQGNFEYHCTPSLGIALLDGQQFNVEESLRQAELALYKSKERGGNTLRFFDPDMQAETDRRTGMEQALRTAIRDDKLALWYQPQFDDKGQVVGAEALLRWHDDELGMVPPDQFIPVAENSGLIDSLGHWVLGQAFTDLEQWSARGLPKDFALSINISPRQFLYHDFTRQVGRLLDQYSVRPQQIVFELTETALLEHLEETAREMMLLQSTGINFALDDFGTGYSSLSYLKRLPLSQLKIDKSFVLDLITDANDAAIARSIIGLGQNLDIEVMAEGVETEDIYEFLLQSGCTRFQGYWFGHPMPVDEFRERFLKALMTD